MSHKLNTRIALSFFSLATVCAACGAQVDPEYKGEAIATVKGALNSQLSSPPANGEAEVSLVWQVTAGSPDYVVSEKVPVSLSMPATFAMSLFAAPQPRALNDYARNGAMPEESRIGVAFVVVNPPGEEPTEDNILGMAEDHLVVYVDKDVQPGSFSEKLLNGQLKAGYHVMEVKRLTEAQKQAIDLCQEQAGTDAAAYDACGSYFDQMHEAPAGLGTQIPVRLVDDSKLLDVPNWT